MEVKQAKLDLPAIAAARQAAQAAPPQGGAVTVGDRSVSVTATWLHLLIRLLHHRAMEMLYAARTSEAHKGDSPAQARTLAKPYLDELRAAPFPNRFEYRERRDIEEDLRALIQLEALGLAEDEYANQNAARPDPMHPDKTLPNAEARARSGGNLPGNDAWCGAFAFSNVRQAGANPFLAQYIQGEGGIVSLGQYGYDHWISVNGGWEKVEKYHKEMRNSPRSYLELPAKVENFNLDIQPGDLVLLDNRWGTRGDHIMMVKSYDKTTGHLEKVAGNEGRPTPSTWAATSSATTPRRTTPRRRRSCRSPSRTCRTTRRSSSPSSRPSTRRTCASMGASAGRWWTSRRTSTGPASRPAPSPARRAAHGPLRSSSTSNTGSASPSRSAGSARCSALSLRERVREKAWAATGSRTSA